MRSWIIVAFALLAAPYAAAAPIASYQPVPLAADDVTVQDGVALTQSAKTNSSVGARPPTGANARDWPVFWLAIKNKSPSPVTIGPDNVTATTDSGAAVRVISVEEVRREAQRNADAARFAAAAQASRNATSAANVAATNASASSRSAAINTGSLQSTNGGERSGTAAFYDSSAGAVADAPANVQTAPAAQNADPNADGLVAQTLAPSAQIVAPLTLDHLPPHTRALTLTMHVGDDVHVFQWTYSQH